VSDTDIERSFKHKSNNAEVAKSGLVQHCKNPSLFILALVFLGGNCALQLQADINGFRWGIGLTGLLLLVTAGLFLLKPAWRIVWFFVWGFLWALLFAQHYLSQQLPPALVGQNIVIEGVINGLPDYSQRSVRFNFAVTRYISANAQVLLNNQNALPSKLRLSWYYSKHKIFSGEHWRIKVRLKPPHGMQNPGGFDYEKWLYQQFIHATGYIRKDSANQLIKPANNSIDSLRENLLSLLSSLPDKTYQGLLQALTIGHKTQINSQQWQVLRHTGTSHLMAISGLHIGLLAAMVFFLGRWLVPATLCRHISASQMAAIFSIVAAGFYALLAGFSVPTQRAFVMLLVFMLAILLKRPVFSLNTWSWALIAVLLINPVSVLSVGFWLSFIAVLVITLISSARIKYSANKLNKWILGFRIQWLIAIAMLPLSALLFQQGSLISPIANMLAIPLVGMIIVPLSLFGSLLSAFSTDMALWLFTQISILLSLIWELLTWLAAFPMANWQRSSIPLYMGGLALIGAVLLLLPNGTPMRYCGLFLLLPMILYQPPKPEKGAFWVHLLDVGQGLAVLIQTQNKTLLYDSGAKFSERFDIGERVIVPYLNYIGVNKLDKLLISHGDNDHAGGADAIMQALEVESLIAEATVFEKKARLGRADSICAAGKHWQWNEVNFEILHPQTFNASSNNRSCVLKISNNHSSFLIAGDIERKAERQMLKRVPQKLAADILLVPHHGSNTSSSPAWLHKVNPQLAIVSAGYKNRFSHPTKKILARYQSHNIDMLNTAEAGMIKLKFAAPNEKPAIAVKQQRKVSTHYWNHRL